MAKNIDDVSKESGVEREIFLRYVEKEWIHPGKPMSKETGEKSEWMDEDVRRAHLIIELQHDFGVNDEAVPIILHLIDQLNAMQRVLRRLDLEHVAEITLKPRSA